VGQSEGPSEGPSVGPNVGQSGRPSDGGIHVWQKKHVQGVKHNMDQEL